jgi:hypothetical protein
MLQSGQCGWSDAETLVVSPGSEEPTLHSPPDGSLFSDEMGESRIEVLETAVRITSLDVARKGVADYFRAVPEDELELAFTQALEVGVFCIERASAARDIDFVRHQIDGLLRSVETTVSTLPGQIEAALTRKIGTEEGQVLAPVRGFVERASQVVEIRLKDVRELLTGDLDPAKTTSTLGRALKELDQLLDPERTDSIQGVLVSAVRDVADEGGMLSKSVKACVNDAIKPLAEQIDRLGQQIAGVDAAEDALLATTKKGAPYEEEIVGELQDWAARIGAEVHYVGPDNRPGDILLVIPARSLGHHMSIVIEVRDRCSRTGRKAITETLETAMRERQANAAIYLSRSSDGLGKEIGDWAEGECDRGPFVAVTHGDLFVALRWLIARHQLQASQEALPEVDRPLLEAQIERIRTSLKRIGTINRSVTQIRGGATSVEDEIEELRGEIRRALAAMEESLRATETKSTGMVA